MFPCTPPPLLCRYFLKFITQSRNTRNRLDSAKELKKLVYFSNIVVAPLLEDLKVGAGARGWVGGWVGADGRGVSWCVAVVRE